MRSVSRVLSGGCLAVAALTAHPGRAAELEGRRASDATYEARLNFVACVNGEAGRCDASRLTDAEHRLVENASSQRNYVACANGWIAGCDPLQLTPEQKRIVDATAAQRAVAPCGSRWALGCGTGSGEPQPAVPDGGSAGTGTQVSSGPPRYELDAQRFYAPGYPTYERYDGWPAGSWIVAAAIAAAATWPLWTHSYHYDYPWYWDDDGYGYPGWWWSGGHGHGGHSGHGGGHHHGGKPPSYRPPPTYRPPPIQRPPSSTPAPRPARPVKHDWR